MKKYLKLQAKKAFSLFLAVVMLMSCWVWFAPEEAKVAQAAEIEPTDTYKIEIKYTIKNNTYGGGNITIKYLGDYGYGTTETSKIILNSLGDKDADGKTGGAVGSHRVEYTLPKGCFPTVVQYTGANAADGCGDDASRFEMNEVIINGKTVCKDSEGFNGDNNDELYVKWNTADGGNPDGSIGDNGTFSWPQPKIFGFVDSKAEAADGKNADIKLSTLKKMNSTDGVSGKTTFDISKYNLYDQYGVAVPASIGKYCTITENTSYVSGSDNGSALNEKYDDAFKTSGDSEVTVTAYPVLQDIQKSEDGTEEFYLVKMYTLEDEWGGKSTSKTSAKISVPYPLYDVKFNGKGSVDDSTFAPALKKDDDSLITNGSDYTVSGYYNNNLPATPAKATAEGYTFYGFWSEPQPATKYADDQKTQLPAESQSAGWFYRKMADFAQPLATEDFDNYMTLSGVEKLELYTVKDENGNAVKDDNGNDLVRPRVIIVDSDSDGKVEKYYDAGVKFDAKNEKQFQSDKEWYGWWCSNDYSIKFYDVDGKFIDEFAVKHGQTAEAIKVSNGNLPKSSYLDKGYTSGAFTYKVVDGVWVDADGEDVTLASKRFVKSLVLRPKLTKDEDGFKNDYTVTFVNPLNGSSVDVGTQGGVYDYRQDITAEANAAKGKISQDLTTEDLNYSYELLGWSATVPSNGKYHILQEYNDFDTDNKVVGLNSDWTVRDEATYYAVYRRHTKTYLVNFGFKDTFGEDTIRQVKVKYGEDLVPPTDYVPYEYNTRGNKYTFADWKYTDDSGNEDEATLAYDGKIRFTSEFIQIYSTALDGYVGTEEAPAKPIEISASYGAPVPTHFKVEFSYPDENGDTVEKSANVYVDKPFSEAFVKDLAGNEVAFDVYDDLNPALEKDEEDAVYTFVNEWKIISGAGTMGLGEAPKTEGESIATDDLETFVPTSDIKFEAVYGNPKPYYTVTYIDGQNTYSEKVLVDSNVPVWTNKVTNENGEAEDKEYIPEDYKGDGGTYVFQGWYDEKQKDAEYKATNGNKITSAVKVTGNLTLYSQFLFVPDTFSIKFVNYDGSVVFEEAKLEKGQSITEMTAAAVAKAEARERDSTYEYIFIGWDKNVPTFCEGKDIVFVAQYKTVYRYYDVKWYNSKLEGDKWVADKATAEVDGKETETYLLATTKHTYDSKLYTPSVDAINCPVTPPEGQSYVFAGWYYNDAEGNAHKYERGMKVTGEMEFYATYTLTAQTFTVTAMVDGKPTYYNVASGEKAALSDPQDGYKDETYHSEFKGWYTDEDCTAEFDADTAITEDTTVYAKFETSEHSFTNSLTKTNPTYYAEGVKEIWCDCDPSKVKTESIPVLEDNVAPTGTIYLGSLGKWSSTDAVGAAASDNDPVTIVANADTDIIITANDTGKKCKAATHVADNPETDEVEECPDCAYDALYNPSSVGKGVRLIRAFVYPGNIPFTLETYNAAQQVAVTVYENNSNDLTNNANFAIKLGDAFVADLDDENNAQYDADGNLLTEKLQSGETYIVYYNVVDKAGNQLSSKVRTAKFIYDDTAPTFEVEGYNNEAAIPTYCGSATVTGIEEGAVLTVNGAAVEVTEGKYVINYAEGVDNIIITATDNAGNTYSKKIKVSDHDYYVTKVASTCYSAGYEEEKCLICKHVKSRKEYPSSGHVMVMSGLVPATCTENGYEVRKCEFCDYSETVIYKVDAEGNTTDEFLYPATGHTFEKDGEEIKYTTVIDSTCKVKGKAQAVCTVCNGELEDGILTKELEVDEENHVNTTVATLEATCTHDGYYKEICNDCNEVLVDRNAENEPDTFKAKGHTEGDWEIAYREVDGESVPWEATCYQPGKMWKKCTVCSAITTEATEFGYTEDENGEYAYVTDEEGNKVTADGKYQYYLLPATGEHVLRVTDYREPSTSETGYIIRKCQTPGCTVEKEENFEKLDSFTVTFLKEDGTELKVINELLTGDKIGAADVTAPEKAADKTNTYTFAGWVEVNTNEDGSTTDGSAVKLPLTVTKNMTLKATYRATKIIYTHKFYVPNTWVSPLADSESYDEFAVLVGAYGDVVKPASEPVFKLADKEADAELKKIYTFKFKGWKDVQGNDVTDFKVTESAKFYAYFEAIPVEYDVIYYNGTEYVWSTKVDGGEAAVFGGETPEKAFDDAYHYEFDKWYLDSSLKTAYNDDEIIGKTQLYAGCKAIAHTYDKSEGKGKVVQAATCVLPELTEYTCSCGYKVIEESKAAVGHKAAEKAVEETRDDGIYEVIYCTVCGEESSATKISYTVVFKNANGVTLQTSNLKKDADIKYEKAEPTLADTADKSYKFIGWYVEGDVTETLVTLDKATGDVVYIAAYEEVAKIFRLTFVDKDNNVITTKEVDYKYVIVAGDFPADQDDYKTTNDHRTFVGWSASVGDEIKADLIVKPVYDIEAHSWEKSDEYAEPDCEQGGGIVWVCKACGATETRDGVATGHKWAELEGSRVEPVGETDGYYYNKCTVCGKVSDKIIIPAAKKRDIVITVKDSNGNAVLGALVEIYQNGTRIAGADTNAAGQVSFKAYEGKYTVLVSGVADAQNATFDFTVGSKGYTGEAIMQIIEETCGCSCHRDGFWGIVFRFFHKIIAFFAGRIICCSCPDGRY